MAKVRVYELAKEFGVESKVVLAKLGDMGEFVRSASSTVEAPLVRRLRDEFADPPPAPASPQLGARHPKPGPDLFLHSDSIAADRRAHPPSRPKPADGLTRSLFSVAIDHFGPTEPGECGPDQFLPLAFAADRARSLRNALSSIGYVLDRPDVERPGAEELGRAVIEVLAAAKRDDFQIVHILSHGERGRTGSVHVVGADGTAHISTDVEHWLKTAEHDSEKPWTLFIFDLCYSGAAARLPWQAHLADGSSRAWVFAACEPDQAAFDGSLTEALANVLQRVELGRLDIDRSLRYIPLPVIARELRREVDALARTNGRPPQKVTCSLVDLSAEVEVPFFPNTAYQASSRRKVRPSIDSGLTPFLDQIDEALDPRHFVGRAAGHGPLADSTSIGLFSGRDRELSALTAWINGDDDGSLRVVTGSPGVGKSALLGVIVCAAHPLLRRPTRDVWERVFRAPGVVPTIAAVHARERTAVQIASSIARQLGILEPRTARDLPEQLATMDSRPLIVIDALDEALDVRSLVDQLLIPLTLHQRENGTSVCRLLVGVRSEPPFAPLWERAREEDGVIDLDQVSDGHLRRDLEHYVEDLLRTRSVYDERAYAAARATFAAAVADTLVRGRNEHRWGEFLVSALYVHHVLTSFMPISDVTEAETLGLAVPSELHEVLELDLKARSDDAGARAALAVLAHARGEGMPASVIEAAAYALLGPPSTHGFDISEALSAIRFYLRHSTDSDGTILYRLFHQGLADYLRAHPARADHVVEPKDTAATIWRSILPPLGAAADQNTPWSRRWDLATPYLLRHAHQHALEVDDIKQLRQDPEFLIFSEANVIDSLFADRDAGIGAFPLAPLFPDALNRELGPTPEDRRATLASRAARHLLTPIALQICNPPGQSAITLQPHWTRMLPSLMTAVDGATPLRNVGECSCVVERGSKGMLVLGDNEGGISVFDLHSGEATMRRTFLSEDPVEAIRSTSVGRWPVAEVLCGGLLHTVDVLSGRLLDPRPIGDQHASFRYPSTPESQIASVIFRDTLLDTWIEDDHSVAILDTTRQSLIAHLSPPDGSCPTAVVGISLGEDALVVCGTNTGSVFSWSLNSGKCLGNVSYVGAVADIIPAMNNLLVIISDLEFGVVNYHQIGVRHG